MQMFMFTHHSGICSQHAQVPFNGDHGLDFNYP